MPDAMPNADLDRLIEAVAARDLAASLAAFSVDHDPALLGSESGEVAMGTERIEAFFRRLYSRPGSVRFDLPDRTWAQHESVAWVVAEGSVVEPSEATAKPYRMSGVFIRERGAWKLALWSGAEPVQSR